jgi:hypothetical protein
MWRYGELRLYGNVALVCLKNWFTISYHIKTITSHVSKAYCVEIHCETDVWEITCVLL